MPKTTTKTKKEVKTKEPLPKDGSFWKYFFWFISTYPKIFASSLVLLFIIVFILSCDIGYYEDVNGVYRFTLDKKAMHLKVLTTKQNNKEEKK